MSERIVDELREANECLERFRAAFGFPGASDEALIAHLQELRARLAVPPEADAQTLRDLRECVEDGNAPLGTAMLLYEGERKRVAELRLRLGWEEKIDREYAACDPAQRASRYDIAEERTTRMGRTIKALAARAESLEDEVLGVRAYAERVTALLRKLEWLAAELPSDDGPYDVSACPTCGAQRTEDNEAHVPGCELADIIGAKVAT